MCSSLCVKNSGCGYKCLDSTIFSLLSFLESTFSSPENITGLKFIVAFPENIAYYYPEHPRNKVNITVLHNYTKVTIISSTSLLNTLTLNAGHTEEIEPPHNLELLRSEISDKILHIISNNTIVVHVVYLKSHSVQTALVVPNDQLGTEYFIPPVPRINGTSHPTEQVTRHVSERGPFRLIIINTDQPNMVNITGVVSKNVSLQPHQVAQVWLKKEEGLSAVSATQPVAVLFGHACAVQYNCVCRQLYTILPPAKHEAQTFYIPPFLTKDVEAETVLLLSERGSSHVRPYNPSTPLVHTAGTAILHRPGLLLTLIPRTDFVACSVVNSVPNANNFAVIIVHKDLTAGVHLGTNSLKSSMWSQINQTDYVSTHVALTSHKNVIWHASSQMAVYFVGHKNGTIFGNPAPIISKTPGRTSTFKLVQTGCQ